MQLPPSLLTPETDQSPYLGEQADLTVYPLDMPYADQRWMLRSELGLSVRTPLYFAIFSPHQIGRCHRLIQSIYRLQWYLADFFVVITSSVDLQVGIEQWVRQYDLSKRVRFLPRTQDFESWILGADACLHASDIDISLREINFAQMRGIPLVARPIPGMPGLTYEPNTNLPIAWIWESEESGDLAFLMNEAIRNSNRRHAIITRARRVAISRFRAYEGFPIQDSETGHPVRWAG